MNRRDFLKGSAATLAVVSSAGIVTSIKSIAAIGDIVWSKADEIFEFYDGAQWQPIRMDDESQD